MIFLILIVILLLGYGSYKYLKEEENKNLESVVAVSITWLIVGLIIHGISLVF